MLIKIILTHTVIEIGIFLSGERERETDLSADRQDTAAGFYQKFNLLTFKISLSSIN